VIKLHAVSEKGSFFLRSHLFIIYSDLLGDAFKAQLLSESENLFVYSDKL
jgi:hypothetical protein